MAGPDVNNGGLERVEVSFPVSDVPGAEGGRLDRFLTLRLKGYSRQSVQRLITEGRVSLRGKQAKASARVTLEDIVRIRYDRQPEEPARYESLGVLYEDERMLAVEKPPDLISHPTDKVVHNSVTSVLKKQFGRKLFLVHRLDRETSGVLVLAKDIEAARQLQQAFEKRDVEKEYLAVVAGEVSFERRRIDAPIGPEGGEIRVRQAARPDGAPAVTEFERVRVGKDISMVRALPKTGRLHQIRVHLAWAGYPILGDKLYTGDGGYYMKAVRREIGPADIQALGAPRQMLHASRLVLPHPEGRRIELLSPIPGDFSQNFE